MKASPAPSTLNTSTGKPAATKPRSISKADPFARKTIDARVFRLQKLADDVMLVHLRFPAGIRAKFKAGQHLNLILDNGESRDFSMANPPRESDGAQPCRETTIAPQALPNLQHSSVG